MYVWAAVAVALNWKTASSSVGIDPPDHVTLLTTAFSPEPVDETLRRHPGAGANESIANPFGTNSSTFVVVRSSRSVGTERVKTWSVPGSTTGGLTTAGPNPGAANARQPSAASTPTAPRRGGHH